MWLLLVMNVVIFLNFIFISRTCFYDLEENFLVVWLTLDYIFDFLFVIDTIIKFRTGK